MHQTVYLPISDHLKQMEPPKIIIVNHQKNSLVTKDSSKEEKINYLRTAFFDNINKSVIEPKPANLSGKIESVWNQILEKANADQMFDINYLFDIYQEYLDFCWKTEIKPHSSIILALLFQRISGPTGSVEKSSDYAYADLRLEFNCSVGLCCKVRRLISSLKTIDIKTDFEESIYRDLNLARLGYSYIDYIRYQNKIDKQSRAMGLTQLECWEVKKILVEKLHGMNTIYIHNHFERKYGKQAKQNLSSYKYILEGKIISMKRGEINQPQQKKPEIIDHKSKLPLVKLDDKKHYTDLGEEIIDIDAEIQTDLSPDARGDSFK